MGIVDRRGTVIKVEELIVASIAQTDALSKLLIEKGLITEAEYMEKLSAERVTYQEIFKRWPFAVFALLRSSAHYGRLSLSHSSCGGKARLAPSLIPPIFAGTLPLSRAVPPDPHGIPSPPHCPVLPSDPFASWASHPTLSLCPLASQATHSPTGRSVRSGL